MTKWVTILLLTLAILVYGMSRMRPDPNSSTSEPTPVAIATPAEEPSDEPAPPPDQENTGAGRQPVKAPNFGPPPGQNPKTQPTPKEVAVAPAGKSGGKVDPFNRQPKAKTPVSGRVKAAVLSDSAGGSSRTKFALNTAEIYVTTTPEGLKDNVDITASYRSVMNEKEEFSAPVSSSGPARRRQFRLTPPEKGWVSGPYQVVFNPKGSNQMLGMVRFEIAEPKEKLSVGQPEPEYLDLVPDLEAMEAQSSFSSGLPEIFLRVSAQKLAPGNTIRTVWSAVEVDRLTAGELIAVASQPAPGEGKDAVFTFSSPPGGFHPGSYKVDVYFEQELVGSQAFFLQPPSKE